MSFWLVSKSGLRKGASWLVREDPLVIGRDGSCGVSISDPSVSRRHCEVLVVDGEVLLRDLGSRNTTFVNGLPVTECVLKPGDEISVGQILFLCSSAERGAAEKTAEGPLQATVTLAEADVIYLADQATIESSGLAHTVRDLTELFVCTRALSRANSSEELVGILESAVVARFAPGAFWTGIVAATLAEGGFKWSWSAASSVSPRPPAQAMGAALSELRGTLIPQRGDHGLELTLVAPIHFGEHRVGVIALWNEVCKRAYDESDLHFLVALASASAPFFGAIEQRQRLERQVERLQEARHKEWRLVGSSKAIKEMRDTLQRAASGSQPVLICGETGTGKELAAHLVHELSGHAAGPMVTVNCAAIPHELFESELFGHEKGAFTGAVSRKGGLIEQCKGGTLFLDEIADLSLDNQARILRVIENKRFRRVGGGKEISIDFRVVTATNKDLGRAVAEGAFREDLYYRIRGIELRLPALRERGGDINELAHYFLDQCRAHAKRPVRAFAPDVLAFLQSQPWPGNVRQLKQAIEAAVTLSRSDYVTCLDFQNAAATLFEFPHSPMMPETLPLSLEEVEKRHILGTLERCNGKVLEAARLLGVGKTMLYEKLAQYRRGQ